MIEDYKRPEASGKVFTASMVHHFLSNHKLFWDKLYDRIPNTHNMYTILGTLVHWCINQYITNGQIVQQDCEDYINRKASECLLQGEADEIRKCYIPMAQASFDFLDSINNQEIFSEKTFSKQLIDGVTFAGTTDIIVGDYLFDIKTTSQLSEIKNIPDMYKTQLYSYIYLARQNGFQINNVGILYISRPRQGEKSEKTGKFLKDYPARLYRVMLDYDQDEYDSVIRTINTIAKQIQLCEKDSNVKKIITMEE